MAVGHLPLVAQRGPRPDPVGMELGVDSIGTEHDTSAGTGKTERPGATADLGPDPPDLVDGAGMAGATELEVGPIGIAGVGRRQLEPGRLRRGRRIEPHLRNRRPIVPTIRPVIQQRTVIANIALDRITGRHLPHVLQRRMRTDPVGVALGVERRCTSQVAGPAGGATGHGVAVAHHLRDGAGVAGTTGLIGRPRRVAGVGRRQLEPGRLRRRRRIEPHLRNRRPIVPTIRPVIQQRTVIANIALDRITGRHLPHVLQRRMRTRSVGMNVVGLPMIVSHHSSLLRWSEG